MRKKKTSFFKEKGSSTLPKQTPSLYMQELLHKSGKAIQKLKNRRDD